MNASGPKMVNSDECKPYLKLASAAIVIDEGDISVSISKASTCRTATPSIISTVFLIFECLFSPRTENQKASTLETSEMSDSFVPGHGAEETKMTEKTPKQEVEQAEPDMTIIMTDNHPKPLYTMLASLTTPALPCESSKLFPLGSRNMATATVMADADPNLDPECWSVVENACQSGFDSQETCTQAELPSERTDIKKSPMTDMELSEPTTGLTFTSYQTEASSPAISTSEDQSALLWRQRMSLLGLDEDKARPWFSLTRTREEGDPSPSFVPRIQEIMDADEISVIATQELLKGQLPVKENNPSTGEWAKKAPGSSLSK